MKAPDHEAVAMITLSSDFGSPYPAAMKGVILQRTDARLVDVAHDFPRQDVRAAAFWLRETLPYFPPAVHLVVIDPGVGTDRDAIVVRAGEHALVGPDNGVLRPVARELAGGEDIEVFRIAEQDPATATGDWPPTPASSTFHGRDVFAPAAARVHDLGIEGFEETDGFVPTTDVVDLAFPAPSRAEDTISGEVLVVDGFGNAITNISGEIAVDWYGEQVTVNGESAPVERMYAAVDTGDRLVTVGSHGNVELAVNQGRGDEAFGVEPGDAIRLDLS
jgi:S-adenosylmethionine hydrolase